MHTSSVDDEGHKHHRFYFTKDGHHHALDLVVRKEELERMVSDDNYNGKVEQGIVRDYQNWLTEALNYGKER
jgi:hypothetical protein